MMISEVFNSCQGEGPDAGIPMSFIRLTGCNLRCSWCDTRYAFEKGRDYLVKELLLRRNTGLECVYITGGEPLLQEEEVGKLVSLLRVARHTVTIATNGSFPPPLWWRDVLWDIDYKCPSAKVGDVFNGEWASVGRKNRIKFVVANEEDLSFARDNIIRIRGTISPTFIISPMISFIKVAQPREDYLMNTAWVSQVWNFCVENGLRFSLQLHKVVFGDRKGV